MFASAFYPHEFNGLFHTSSPRCAYRNAPPHERRRVHCGGRPQGHRQGHPFYTAQYYIVPDERAPEERINTKIDPKVSLSQSSEAYGIEAEIPGFSKDQITVEFTNSKTLRLYGSTAPVEAETAVTERASHDQEAPRVTTTEHTEHERSRSTSPKRTSIEEVRDETETDYIEIASEGRAQSPIFTESRTVSPAPPAPQPQPQRDVVKDLQPAAQRKPQVPTKSFEKLIDLPRDIDRDGVSADLKDGILRVRIARVRPDETRRRIVVA